MTVEAIVFIVIAILLVGVPAFFTFCDDKHYHPYTEVVCLNNNSFIVETKWKDCSVPKSVTVVWRGK